MSHPDPGMQSQSQSQSLPDNQGAGIVGIGVGDGPGPDVMAAATLDGNKVVTIDGEYVGKISDIMLDVRTGRIAYAVLSEGGFLGMGSTLHTIPWGALTLNVDEKVFLVDLMSEQIKNAPGFDKDHWPMMADPLWASSVHDFYHRQPYWTVTRDVVDARESNF
jgi:sporulation protein YlmC with PRC-barrel domain